MRGSHTNWAGNVSFAAKHLRTPSSIEEMQDIVAGSDRIHAVGSGHSFSSIADSAGTLVCLGRMPPMMRIDADASTVTVGGGVPYRDLAGRLSESGYALRNLASLSDITVAGACATATHGSGDSNGNLATTVRSMQLVNGGGDVVTVSPGGGDDRFQGTVVGVGALGIVISLTLEIVPAFEVAQQVYENLPYEQFYGNHEAIFASAYSVSLFTDWRDARFTQAWLKHRTSDGTRLTQPGWMGASVADGARHPVPGADPARCTDQGGAPGPWHDRLPHFRSDSLPSTGAELQSEYLLPRDAAPAALKAIDRIRELVAPAVQISELRSVAGDELWLSPSYRQDSVAIHFTWHHDPPAVFAALRHIEQQLRPFGARPHWGKLFVSSPDEIRSSYDRLPDFQRLRREHDPAGTFGNGFLDRFLPLDS